MPISEYADHHQSAAAPSIEPPLRYAGMGSAAVITALAVAGGAALAPLWVHMAGLWLTDPLRTIGAAFPIISLIGVLAVWRDLHWNRDGSWWGLVPVALAIYLSSSVAASTTSPIFSAQYWREVHPGPDLFLYAAGAVLLFGGTKLLRAALPPLCLLLCINPVPERFNLLMDMPLQQLGADTARSFAHLIGLHPTGEQLRMMFAPQFGMMIVPGCNGIRGSITLAYLALIYGYTRRLKPLTLAWVTAMSLLLGYAMNLLRLCVLVVYYRVGMSVPSIQPYGAGVDYVIGCTIFLLGTFGLGIFIAYLGHRDARTPEPPLGSAPDQADSLTQPDTRAGYSIKAAVFSVLVLASLIHERPLLASMALHPIVTNAPADALPRTVGDFHLDRAYSETMDGRTVLELGDYSTDAAPDGAAHRITLGLYVGSSVHQVRYSKRTQGIVPEWTGLYDVPLPGAHNVSFGTSFYDDGTNRTFDMETVCTETICQEPFGTGNWLSPLNEHATADGRHLPLLLRGEWPHNTPTPSAALREGFQQDAARFVAQLNLAALVDRAGSF